RRGLGPRHGALAGRHPLAAARRSALPPQIDTSRTALYDGRANPGEEPPMNINDLLKIAVERKACALHLKVGSHPVIRVDGELLPLIELKRLMQEDTIAMAFSIMNARQKQLFKEEFEIDIAYSVPGLGRFRCNIFQQRGTVGMVLRVIPVKILSIRELMLPIVLEKIAGERRGLILCTGTTGSGKSTTLAAMI